MGLFDKLFGGKPAGPDANATQPSAPSPATPMPEGPVPPRRERSRPGDVVAAHGTNAAGEPLAPLPMDGENAALLAAINAVVADDNAHTRRALYATLLESELFLVSMGGDDLGTGEVTLLEGQQLMLATMKGPDGNVFLPAFTDVERLARTLPEKARYLRMPAPAVCRMFLQGGGEGIVINAGMPPSGMITRGEAQVLAAGIVPQVNEHGQLVVPTLPDAPIDGGPLEGVDGASDVRQSVQQGPPQPQAVQQQMRIAIGRPEQPPSEAFVAAIAGKCAEMPLVREAHLFQAIIEDQPARLMIGLLMEAGLTPELMHPSFDAIGKAAFDARGDAEAFDMMPLNDDMIEAIRPVEGIVYSRSQQV